MYQEILQAIIGIVNVLNISDKLDSLNSSSKKRKLGKQFIKLYESISRSIIYSQDIEAELKRIVSLEEENFSFRDIQEGLCEITLPRLADLLTKQKYELLEFKRILCTSEKESLYIPLLIEIYGNDMELEFNKISMYKYSFLDWVDYYLLRRVSADEIIIPKTFKLSDIPVFQKSYKT